MRQFDPRVGDGLPLLLRPFEGEPQQRSRVGCAKPLWATQEVGVILYLPSWRRDNDEFILHLQRRL